MKNTFLSFLFAFGSLAAMAQSSTWDVHPLNMIPCAEWINPAPGCGGCSSCRVAIDSEPSIVDGGSLSWSPDLVICPHPFDTLGNNVVLMTGWPIEATPSTYFYGQVVFLEEMRIDTLEVIAARANGGPDSIDIAMQYNTSDPPQGVTTLLHGSLQNQLQTYTITDLGCAPMWSSAIGWANIQLRAHGGDQGFLFKGMRVVTSPCMTGTTSVAEEQQEEVIIRAVDESVHITTDKPTPLFIYDAMGRETFRQSRIMGSTIAPLSAGLNIVRVGDTVKRIVR